MLRRVAVAVVLVVFAPLLVSAPVRADDDTEPRQRACVGDPPRQTLDPMSPPCVPFFDGDNGGSTSPGVTSDEFRVIVTFDVGGYGSAPAGYEATPPAGTYVDVDQPPKPPCTPTVGLVGATDPNECDHVLVRVTRAWSRFFNSRYETYHRRGHYYAYFTGASSPEERRADADHNWRTIEPFAVLDQAIFNGFNEAYVAALADRGVMVFGTPGELSNGFMGSHAPHVWSFDPSLEHRADLYASYVCQGLAGGSVEHAGAVKGVNPYDGRERKYGLYYSVDPDAPGHRRFADLVKPRLAACGISAPVEAVFEHEGFIVNGGDDNADATGAVARFQGSPGTADDVTTVLWLGGVEGRFSHTAAAMGYFPEIVLAGDGELDSNATGTLQNPLVWQNAWAVHHELRRPPPAEDFRTHMYRTFAPHARDTEVAFGRALYRDHFLLYYAVQISGPILTPENIDDGLHAIPENSSTDPFRAACFYETDDYSCVKDAAEVWWDPFGRVEGSTSRGCMRMVEEGRRYQAHEWPSEGEAFRNRRDPCTAYSGSWRLRAL